MPDRDSIHDAIIVGGGGSGLAAAASAAQLGARVLVLERRPHLGGTTGIAVGSFTASGTRYQRRAGVLDDGPVDHEADAALFAPRAIEARGNRDLRRFFLEHAAETLEWLQQLGLAFHGPSPEPPNRVPRMHNVVPNAKAYIAALQAEVLRRGGEIRCGVQVDELIREDGRVCGVRGSAGTFFARSGVVLAAGDYANNPELIRRFKGSEFGTIEGINPHSVGAGHHLVESVGGKLVNMDVAYGPELRFVPPQSDPFTQLLPSGGLGARILGALLPVVPKSWIRARVKRLLVTWQHPEDALFDDGAVLVNRRGERFCDEKLSPDREIAISEQPGKVAFILLGRDLIERYNGWPHFVSTAPEIAYAYVDDYLKLRRDVAVEAASIRELADRRGLPPDSLEASAEAFGRTDSSPSAADRWVLLGPAKAYFTTTEGGAAITTRFEVLDDEDDEPIPGLYAVGQNGLGGQILWGHGLHIAWAMTSGRLVGRVIAAS